MAYNTDIENRIDGSLQKFPAALRSKMTKKKMFGGLAYLYSGKMTVGIVGEDLMVRIVDTKLKELLTESYIRPMDFTNRPMKEFAFVSKEGFSDEARLQQWIGLGLEHARKYLQEI